jgi:hypothetical protein
MRKDREGYLANLLGKGFGVPGRYGIVSVIIGLLLIVLSLYWNQAQSYSHSRQLVNVLSGKDLTPVVVASLLSDHDLDWSEVGISLVQAIGVTVFALGIINIIVETKDWRNYFESRIRDIVIEQSYLQTLDQDILTALQTNVLKALFRDQNIDREGSFLNYFHRNLHRYIADPYREDVTCELITEFGDGDTWKIYDRVTYVCRKAAGGIQDAVRWIADDDEFRRVVSLKIEVQLPYHNAESGKREVLIDEKDLSDCRPNEISIEASLEKFADIDGLIVVITAEYVVGAERFQYWEMAHPTRNFDISIMFPVECTIQIKPMVINPDLVLATQRAGYYKAKYDSWMLPRSGLAWRILPPTKPGCAYETVEPNSDIPVSDSVVSE